MELSSPLDQTPDNETSRPPPQPLPGSGLNPPCDPPAVALRYREPEDGDGGDGDPSEAVGGDELDVPEWIDVEAQKRLWVRTIIPLLQLRSHDSDPSGRVQLAFDLAHIACCERVARIMRSDLPDDRG